MIAAGGDVPAGKVNPDPIEVGCPCLTCKKYTRKMLSMICAKESIASVLLTVHNLTFMHRLMQECRDAIRNNKF